MLSFAVELSICIYRRNYDKAMLAADESLAVIGISLSHLRLSYQYKYRARKLHLENFRLSDCGNCNDDGDDEAIAVIGISLCHSRLNYQSITIKNRSGCGNGIFPQKIENVETVFPNFGRTLQFRHHVTERLGG